MRSLSIVCQELGIPDIEIHDILSLEINGISIEEWANQNVEQFQANQKLLDNNQKKILFLYLKKVEAMLK